MQILSDMNFNYFYKILAFLPLFIQIAFAYGPLDVEKLKNDKEVESTLLKKSIIKNLSKNYPDKEFNKNLQKFFYKTVLDFLNDSKGQCELDLVDRYIEVLKTNKINHDVDSVMDYYSILRSSNAIDDLLLEILARDTVDYFELNEIEKNYFMIKKQQKIHLLLKREELLKENDLQKLFENFKVWPNDNSVCTYQVFNDLKNAIKIPNLNPKDKKPNDHFEFLAKSAYKKEIIPYTSLLKLLYLNQYGAFNKRDNSLNSYFEIIFKAKNSMIPKNYVISSVNFENQSKFSTEKVRRFNKLTRRKTLYRKYSETQIILLSQILQKSSRRMGVDPDVISGRPFITQEFTTTNENGEPINYVEKTEIDPQSQYNLARRLMRKDILDLQTMDIFRATKITFEDIVMAALETGYISLEDINYVVQYDDLWNPTVGRFEKISKFIFTIAGYTTFYLPPPWNVFTSMALGIIGGVIDNRTSRGVDNDNPATFIE